MNGPCKDCKKRILGCHSGCPEYIEFKNIVEEEKALRRENMQFVSWEKDKKARLRKR